MSAALEITLQPKTALTDATRAKQRLFARVDYSREVPAPEAAGAASSVAASVVEELNSAGETTFDLPDGVGDSTVEVKVETAQGLDLSLDTAKFPADGSSKSTVAIILDDTVYSGQSPLQPGTTAQLERSGRFTRFTDALPDFGHHRFFVAPIRPGTLNGAPNPQTAAANSLLGLSGGSQDITSFEVKELDPIKASPADGNALGLRDVSLRADGTFDFVLPVTGDEVGWLWMLLGSASWIGYQVDPIKSGTVSHATIILPPPAQPVAGTGTESGWTRATASTGPPMDFDEDLAVNNPGAFGDDPGSNCTPFSNPHRILGERPFYTVLRVDQPQIGGAGSLAISRPIVLDLAPPLRASAVAATFPAASRVEQGSVLRGLASGDDALSRTVRLAASASEASRRAVETRTLLDAALNKPITAEWRKWVESRLTQRRVVSPAHPIEWEGNPTIYQAGSVAGGHILEHRVLWRSHGYSLGKIEHTLTLAPRQTRRIAKVSWRRQERAARQESTSVRDEVSQTTLRDRDYSDAVASTLGEWSRGGSRSSTTGAAGGIGFALGPVVIGGGAAHGSASSSSWQMGGRRVAASEQQSLRDAIRQFADSVRSLESTVVTELSQEEEVEGVTEIVRNINYCHALTVIYHEILRHYRVDTSFAGVRECLFVPFSISPFDVNKTLKWRDKLRSGILARHLRWALDHLDEVANAWADSDIPAGPRSSHPINYITGSAYIKLSIERPDDRAEEETIEVARERWTRIARLLGMSANAVMAQITQINRDRDGYFQREIAPTIAAKWVDRIKLVVGGSVVGAADFTLASSYKFGGTVRVDFTVPVGKQFDRNALRSLNLISEDPLPVGSVANLARVEFNYQTDHFDTNARSIPSTNDLVKPDTGAPDTTGAEVLIPLTAWERQDLRRVIEDAVDELIVHLNANLVYYHKVIWWLMDRDELFMLLDGFIAPYGRRLENGKWVEDAGRSIGSVVEREPIGILGNSLVFRVASGVFLGIDGHQSPDDLHKYYYDSGLRPHPLRVSLPTDGLYAQALMDPCEACEEHFGSTDWVLTNEEPELESMAEQLGTRRQAPDELEPSKLPETLINLQNAPVAPEPTGLGSILGAVTNAAAFRDMAGLTGTQANAMGALSQAASLASSFGQMAVDFQKSKQGTTDAKQKLSNIQKAKSEKLIDDGEAQRQSAKVLDEQNMSTPSRGLTDSPEIRQAIRRASEANSTVDVQRQSQEGVESVRLGPGEVKSTEEAEHPSTSFLGSPAPGTNSGSTQATASAAVTAFAARTTGLKFNVTRHQVATSLETLLSDVDSLKQGNLNLCGPAAMLRTVLRRDPVFVMDFVTDLVEKGQARWGPRLVKPGTDLRNQTFRQRWGVSAGPWVAMASLRDDENWFFDFEGTQDDSLSGATTPGEIEDWLKETGLYTSVRNEANLVITEDKSHLLGLTVDNNHDNILLVHSHLLRNAPKKDTNPPGATSPETKKSDEYILRSFPNHWIVLASKPMESGGNIKMDVWSWGNIYSLDIPVATFEANYYGAVIAKV